VLSKRSSRVPLSPLRAATCDPTRNVCQQVEEKSGRLTLTFDQISADIPGTRELNAAKVLLMRCIIMIWIVVGADVVYPSLKSLLVVRSDSGDSCPRLN
jgi:hypothetical protein